MMKIAVSIISVCVLVTMLMSLPIWSEAQPGGKGGKGGRPPGPPEEAVAACEGKSEGDSCEFASPRGDEISGTCRSIEEQLACAPEGAQAVNARREMTQKAVLNAAKTEAGVRQHDVDGSSPDRFSKPVRAQRGFHRSASFSLPKSSKLKCALLVFTRQIHLDRVLVTKHHLMLF